MFLDWMSKCNYTHKYIFRWNAFWTNLKFLYRANIKLINKNIRLIHLKSYVLLLEIKKTLIVKKYRLPWLVWLSGLSTGWKQKGHQFYSPLGHTPRLQARSPFRGVRGATCCCFSGTSIFLFTLPRFPFL